MTSPVPSDAPESEITPEPRLTYAPPTHTPRDEFDAVMSSGTPSERAQAFLGYVHTEEDWEVTEDVCFAYLDDNDDPNIRRLAILFLGYIPRLHGTVHLWRVIPTLGRIGRLDEDSTLTCTAEDALGDVVLHMGLVVGRNPYRLLPWRVSTAVQKVACWYARKAIKPLLADDDFDIDVAHAAQMLLNTGQTRDACAAFSVVTAWAIHFGVRFAPSQVARMASASLLVGFPTRAWRDLTDTPAAAA